MRDAVKAMLEGLAGLNAYMRGESRENSKAHLNRKEKRKKERFTLEAVTPKSSSEDELDAEEERPDSHTLVPSMRQQHARVKTYLRK